MEEARHRHPPGRAVAMVILGALRAALPRVLGRDQWLGVKGLASLGPFLGAPADPGAGKTYWGHGVRGLASPDPLSGATQHVAGIGRWLVPCSCSGRFRCKVPSTEAVKEFRILFTRSWTLDIFIEPVVSGRHLPWSCGCLWENFTLLLLAVKSLDIISTSPSFSAGVSPLCNAWFYSGTCYASVWKLMEAIHMFYGVVNLDAVADTRPTLQRLIYDHADWRSMYS